MRVPSAAGPECSPYVELLLRLPPDWVPERACPLCTPPRVERDAFADARTSWPFEWLALLGRLPHEEQTFLSRGHVVEVADRTERDEALPFSGFYFDPAHDEAGDREIPPLARSGDRRVEFLGVVPLHPAEVRAFRHGRGSEALRALDAMNVTDLLVADRPPCVADR